MGRFASLLALILSTSTAWAEAEDSAFVTFQLEQETTCVGDPEARLDEPVAYELGDYAYEVEGATAKVTRKTGRKASTQRRFGILNAIKDNSAETQANVNEYLAKFKEADVDGIIIGGNTAYNEFELEAILERVASAGLPVYALIGNLESASAFNRACKEVHRRRPNLLNVDLVRTVNADGVHFVSLPGYFDKNFTHATGPCVYVRSDLKAFPSLAEGLEGPVVALSHGPPLQSGTAAIDYTADGKNGGDPAFARALSKTDIRFGIFGRVTEAGGTASDASGQTAIRPNAPSDALYLNPGSANAHPQRMNNGTTSYGMAAIVTFEGDQARYEVLKSPRRFGLKH